jgi:hypothetical protein
MSRLHEDDHAGRCEPLVEQCCDLLGQAFLKLGPASIEVDHSTELRQAKEPLTRKVTDVGGAEEWQKVVRADRIEGNAGDGDDSVIPFAVRKGAELRLGIRPEAAEQFPVGTGNARVGPGEVGIIEVEAQGLEEAPKRRGDSGGLDRPSAWGDTARAARSAVKRLEVARG